MTLNEEDTNLPITCLDLHFYYHRDKQCITTTIHSKNIDPKFKGLPFTRYPHPHSYIDPHILYNSFTTELYRFHRGNTFISTFITDTNTLITYLCSKGYSMHKLINKLKHYIKINLPFYTYTSRKHVIDLILAQRPLLPNPSTS